MPSQSPPNKSYKIDPFYNMLFHSILSIYQRDKLTEFFIKTYFNFEEIRDLPRYKKGELLKEMLDSIQKNDKSIRSFSKYLSHERIAELRKLSLEKGANWSSNRVVLNVRIPKDLQDTISDLAKGLDTVGEVIEIAIAYFVSNCSEAYYKLIKFSFLNHVSK